MEKMKLFITECGLVVDIAHCGISPLIFCTDGLRILTFKGKKGTFIRVSDALAWFEEELDYTLKHGGKQKDIDRHRVWIAEFKKAIELNKEAVSEMMKGEPQ